MINAVHGQNIQGLPGKNEVGVIAKCIAVTPENGFRIEIKFIGNRENRIPRFNGVFNDLIACIPKG